MPTTFYSIKQTYHSLPNRFLGLGDHNHLIFKLHPDFFFFDTKFFLNSVINPVYLYMSQRTSSQIFFLKNKFCNAELNQKL